MATSDCAQDQVSDWQKVCVCVTLCVCVYRECVNSMEGLGLPEKGVSMLRSLAMNVRSLCADTLFQRAAKGAYSCYNEPTLLI